MKQTKPTIHKNNWRLWLQNCDQMTSAGFTPNARYNVEYKKGSIVLILDPLGKRKVSKTARGGTLDLNNSKLAPDLWDFSAGAIWDFSTAKIIIKGVK